VTVSTVPIEDPTKPVYARGSSLQIFEDCSLSWFMSQRALAAEAKTIALSFGTIVHAFAQAINEGDLDPENSAQISALLDQAFSKLQLDAPWSNAKEQKNALECINSFLKWRASADFTVAGAEIDFKDSWEVTSPDGERETVTLRGQIDMILVDAAGAVYIADIKTNGQAASAAKTETNKQLAIYQTAVARGLVEQQLGPEFGEPVLGGAVLLFVRARRTSGDPSERSQPALTPSPETGRTWIEEFMAVTATRIRKEDYRPTVGDSCSYCVIKSSCPLMAEGRPVIS
jgi:RecB family exonuclease